jgi:hypothetical protein
VGDEEGTSVGSMEGIKDTDGTNVGGNDDVGKTDIEGNMEGNSVGAGVGSEDGIPASKWRWFLFMVGFKIKINVI